MTISLGYAIKRIKDEPLWKKKSIALAIVCALQMIISFAYGMYSSMAGITTLDASYLIVFILTLPLSAYIIGFVFSSMHKTFNSDKFQMIELSQKNLILDGLKYVFQVLGYSLLLGLIVVVAEFVVGIISAIISILLGVLISLVFGQEIMSIFMSVFVFVVCISFMLYLIQLVNAGYTCYIKTLKFGNLIAFKKHFNIIKTNQHAAWTLTGKVILYTLLFALIAILCTITIVGVILLPFVSVIAMFTYYNLLDQYAKKIDVMQYLQ